MAQQTAVELLHKKSNELITQYLDNKITKRDLITMHHNILYPYKAMGKEQIEEAFSIGEINNDSHHYTGRKIHQDQKDYFNKTYSK